MFGFLGGVVLGFVGWLVGLGLFVWFYLLFFCCCCLGLFYFGFAFFMVGFLFVWGFVCLLLCCFFFCGIASPKIQSCVLSSVKHRM